MNETAKTDWSVILRKAAWISLGLGIVLILINSFFPSFLKLIAINVAGIDLNLGGTFLGVLLVAILVLFIADFIGTTRPFDRANSRFWIGRAFFDLFLAFLFGNVVLMPLIFSSLSNIADFRQPFNTLLTIVSGRDMFLMTLATGAGLTLIILLRYLSHALPPGLFKFKTTNLWKDLLFVLLVSAGALAFSFAYDFVVSRLGINVQMQYTFDKKALEDYGIFFILLGGAVIAPICEELFFRGYLLPLLSTKGKWFGLIVSSLIFAMIHLYLAGLVALFVVGLILAISYQKRQNLLVSISIHMVNNFVACILMIVQVRGGL